MPHKSDQGSIDIEFKAATASPLVSCVIIFLNEEKFLAEAIESVLAQTYTNWELLLVDDGSSDSSAAIAQRYCEDRPKRIRYLTHDGGVNRGMSASRNLGLREARGRLIALLDADDIWVPEKLEQQVAIFDRYPGAIMTCGATLYWHGWQSRPAEADALVRIGDEPSEGRTARAIKQDRLYHPMELLRLLYPLGHGTSPSTSALAFKRDFALEVGGFDESFPGLFEDQVFMVKAYVAGPIYVSSLCFDRYRQHSQSCTHVMQGSSEAREIRRRYLRWLKTYLREVGVRDLRWKLRKATLRCDHPKLYHVISKFVRTLRD